MARLDVLRLDAVRVSGGADERERCDHNDSGSAHAQAGPFADRVVHHFGSPWLAELVENSGSSPAILGEDGRRSSCELSGRKPLGAFEHTGKLLTEDLARTHSSTVHRRC